MTIKQPTLAEQLEAFGSAKFTPYDPATGEGLERPKPSGGEYAMQIEDGEYVAPGRAAEHRYGIMFRADHETLADGMCRQARAHARALSKFLPVHLASIQSRVRLPADKPNGIPEAIYSHAGDDMLQREVFEEVGALRQTRIQNYLSVIYHTTIQSAAGLQRLLLPEHTRAVLGADDALLRRTIVYVPWERSTVHPDIITLLNRCGQVWLQCNMNVEVFTAAGLAPSKIRYVPPIHDQESLVSQVAMTVAPRGRRFYNIGKWEPRKAQHELIGAFLKAFKPSDAASLTVKTSWFGTWKGYPAFGESIPLWLEDATVRALGWTAENVGSRVFLYTEQFTETQIAKLHELNNIYVSASHAEGWDYPAFDAKLAGNRLVHVGYGGTSDFAQPDDIKIAYEMGPVAPSYGWDGALWANYQITDLSVALAIASPQRRGTPFFHTSNERCVGPEMFFHLERLSQSAGAGAEWAEAVKSWRKDAD